MLFDSFIDFSIMNGTLTEQENYDRTGNAGQNGTGA